LNQIDAKIETNFRASRSPLWATGFTEVVLP
jgi:hypothetical protein